MACFNGYKYANKLYVAGGGELAIQFKYWSQKTYFYYWSVKKDYVCQSPRAPDLQKNRY